MHAHKPPRECDSGDGALGPNPGESVAPYQGRPTPPERRHEEPEDADQGPPRSAFRRPPARESMPGVSTGGSTSLRAMVSSSPTTVVLTCWSTYAPSNAQEWPAWIKASDLASKSCGMRGSADRAQRISTKAFVCSPTSFCPRATQMASRARRALRACDPWYAWRKATWRGAYDMVCKRQSPRRNG